MLPRAAELTLGKFTVAPYTRFYWPDALLTLLPMLCARVAGNEDGLPCQREAAREGELSPCPPATRTAHNAAHCTCQRATRPFVLTLCECIAPQGHQQDP